MLLVVPSCDDGLATGVVHVHLGAQPPLLRAKIGADVAPLPRVMRLREVFSTCRCVAARVFADGRELHVGDVVQDGVPLRLQLDYESAGKTGRAVESVVARFRPPEGQGRPVRRELKLHCTHERDRSLTDGNPVKAYLMLPSQGTQLRIALSRPIDEGGILLEGGDWLGRELVEWDSAAGQGYFLLRLSGIDVAGDYDGAVLLPVGERVWEKVPVKLVARAPQQLRPTHVLTRMRCGSRQVVPLRLLGPEVRFTKESVEWTAGRHRRAAAATSRDAFSVDITTAPEAGSRTGLGLAMHIAAGTVPGLYEGRALIRPHPAAAYRLPLRYVVRVLGTEHAPEHRE